MFVFHYCLQLSFLWFAVFHRDGGFDDRSLFHIIDYPFITNVITNMPMQPFYGA